MAAKRRILIWVLLSAGFTALSIALFVVVPRAIKGYALTLQGAVLKQDTDPRRQVVIPDAEITIADDPTGHIYRSNSSGVFILTLPRHMRHGDFVTLRFRAIGYKPLVFTQPIEDRLYIVRMAPLTPTREEEGEGPKITVGNVLARYSIRNTTEVNIGSGVKTFEVVNAGNVPCRDQAPCSPDGKWKAAIGSASLDAGPSNAFRNATVSCIAGPCGFAKIESDNFSRGGRIISVAVRNWSDTVTFLIEAEAYHPMASDAIRDSYPVILGRTLHFILPQAAEGPSILAEINGEPITFPLGPTLCLSWAQCSVKTGTDQSKAYQCELKPGYRFK